MQKTSKFQDCLTVRTNTLKWQNHVIAAKAAVFQPPLHHRTLQHQKNSVDFQRIPLHQKVILDVQSLLDLECCVNNLPTVNTRPVNSILPNILIQSDTSGSGWGLCATAYTFPPFNLINKYLKKKSLEGATLSIVYPV